MRYDLSATLTEYEVDIARVVRPRGVKPIKRSQAAMTACLPIEHLHLGHSRR
jgi:hypothetical protein